MRSTLNPLKVWVECAKVSSPAALGRNPSKYEGHQNGRRVLSIKLGEASIFLILILVGDRREMHHAQELVWECFNVRLGWTGIFPREGRRPFNVIYSKQSHGYISGVPPTPTQAMAPISGSRSFFWLCSLLLPKKRYPPGPGPAGLAVLGKFREFLAGNRCETFNKWQTLHGTHSFDNLRSRCWDLTS